MKLLVPLTAVLLLLLATPLVAQPPQGRGGPGRGAKRELLGQFDANEDGWLNREERAAARKFVEENPPARRGGRGGDRGGRRGNGGGRFDPAAMFEREDENSDGKLTRDEVANSPLARDFSDVDTNGDDTVSREEFDTAMNRMMRRGRRGGPGGGRGGANRPTPKPGEKIAIADVQPAKGDLYDPSVLRTIFVEFENEDWEKELETFHNTDVEVPATLTVDGKEYPLCGLRFRGMSSYMMVRAGHKRSFNVSLDLVKGKQRLYGYKTLNLLNCNGDPSLMSTVLYSRLASEHMPVPKANFVRVVVNGENWGVYTNVQQFNKEFLKENFGSTKGTRWKVEGSPRGGGGLDYRGDDPEEYGHPYVMKDGNEKALEKLIELCRIMDEVPADELKAALADKIDIDGLLWFLAYDNALCNSDGYWVRASDYSIYLDKNDRFHIIPHDMNEAFRPANRGRRGRRGEDRAEQEQPRGLDPLIGLNDETKPLRSKILAVPEFREQYLDNIRTIADQLKWENLGPIVADFRDLIGDEVKRDTRKLSTYEAFVNVTSDNPSQAEAPEEPEEGGRRGGRGGGRGATNLRKFAEERRAFLLESLGDAKNPEETWL